LPAQLAGRRALLLGAYVTLALIASALIVAGALLARPRLAGGRPPPAEGWLAVAGDALALLILSLASLQFLLSSRYHWMERPWGLDRLLRLHRRMGPVIGLLVITHPSVLAAALALLADARSSDLFAHFADGAVWLGALAAAAVGVQLLTTYFVEEMGLTFERWRAVHQAAVVVVVAGFLHAWDIGPHFARPGLVGAIAAGWLGVALATVVYRKVVKPARLRRQAYRVVEVRQETHDTWTVRMAPPAGEVFSYLPGQFIFLTLYRQGFRPEEHPFTLSSSPASRDAITVTPKAIGDFTSTIKETRPGDLAAIDGPYGRFTYLDVADRPLLLISGGVGITPFASYLRHVRDTRSATDVLLIDANKASADILFRTELEEIAASCPSVRIVHVLSAAEASWEGPRGYVDEAFLRQHVPDIADRVIFLCGPPAMMRLVRQTLSRLGVPPSHIRFEEFRLR
jgi:predicted ferric reductase